jgi:hypothetical protein
MVSECNLKLIIVTSVVIRVLRVTYDCKQLSTWRKYRAAQGAVFVDRNVYS